VDWRLDPGILGLEQETGFALDFHMEKFVDTTAHLDLLLGLFHPRVAHPDLNTYLPSLINTQNIGPIKRQHLP
jgi:hypothetical protein